MSAIPEWALKYRQKGTQITEVNGHFYLYKVTSKWNKEKGRAQKITEGYLGKITPDGLIKPRAERAVETVMKKLRNVTVKEYGASFMLNHVAPDIMELLRKHYGEWKEIFLFGALRLFHTTPIKNLEFYYETSFLSELLPDADLSDRTVGQLLREIGMDRNKMTEFMKNFVSGTEYAVIDLTHVFSLSEGVISSMLGHNSKREYLPQVNVLYLFSLDRMSPVYFRVLVGSVTSVSSVKLTMQESGAKNAVLIGDKGFYSKSNVDALEAERMHYILPLKRDSALIDYGCVKEELMEHFIFQGRPIWCHLEEREGRRVFLFQDSFLKTEEEKDFLVRIEEKEEKGAKMKEFHSVRSRLGTIAVITDLKEEGRKVYQLLRARVEIEQLYDTFKNLLHADRTYMRDDYQMEGWMFVNFLAMMLYYRLYNELVGRDMLSKYSPKDVLEHLARVQKLKIGDEWVTTEIPKKSRAVIERLKIPIT